MEKERAQAGLTVPWTVARGRGRRMKAKERKMGHSVSTSLVPFLLPFVILLSPSHSHYLHLLFFLSLSFSFTTFTFYSLHILRSTHISLFPFALTSFPPCIFSPSLSTTTPHQPTLSSTKPQRNHDAVQQSVDSHPTHRAITPIARQGPPPRSGHSTPNLATGFYPPV